GVGVTPRRCAPPQSPTVERPSGGAWLARDPESPWWVQATLPRACPPAKSPRALRSELGADAEVPVRAALVAQVRVPRDVELEDHVEDRAANAAAESEPRTRQAGPPSRDLHAAQRVCPSPH